MTVNQCVCGEVIDHDECACAIRDSDCIRIDGSGSALNPYHPEPIIDLDTDNLLSCAADGLLVELPTWMRNPDRCQVYRSTNLSLTTNVSDVVEFDSERYDPNIMHSTSTNNTRINILTEGIYVISFVCAFAANGDGGRQAFLRKNGKDFLAGVHRFAGTSTLECGINVTTQEHLKVGEYVEVSVKQTSGVTLNLIGNTRYSPIFTVQFRRLPPE